MRWAPTRLSVLNPKPQTLNQGSVPAKEAKKVTCFGKLN